MKRIRPRTTALVISTAILAAVAASPATGAEEKRESPPGRELSTKTNLLEAGAEVLQSEGPVSEIGVYLVGFHPMKDDPSHQMIAHHYCDQVNEDFAQCILFDGNDEDASMNGIEYIISGKLFESLPSEEKKYWHPHNYEILSGQLVAPGIPDLAEHELMEGKMNSYGKTWHVWKTGVYGQPDQELPLGEPHLAWSFNRDGEAQDGIVAARDEALGLSTEESKANRRDLVAKAKPQCGVDAIKGAFQGSTKLIDGVSAKSEDCPREGAKVAAK